MKPLSQVFNRRALLLLVGLATSLGCSRAYWRRQADVDAYSLVRQKADNPHWALEDYTISVDPRSRMYDPFCLDAPPMPPDDPTGHNLMHCVDNKRGYPGWHDNGDAAFVENPAWPAYMEFENQGVVRLSSNDAVRLGILHSRNYQQELEELYLSALDVSFERFRFDAQGFGGYSLFYTADGYKRRGGNNNSSSTLDASLFSNGVRPLYVQKAFTSGATAVVGVANSLVWQFSGPDDHTANTLVDFTLVQPLLRNAGRDRVMERLTRSERTLLANVRAMEQYRQGYYVQVMTGRDPGQGPQRQGGVFGAGLEGFSGIGGGGFGRVQTTAANAGGGGTGGQGAGAGAVGGYLGLLQLKQTIRNQEDNIERLRNNLTVLADLLRARLADPADVAGVLSLRLQVAQNRQALVNAESRLVNSRNDYQTQLDAFKVILGVPPTLCLEIQDGLLDDFQLIDPQTFRASTLLENRNAEIGAMRSEIFDAIVSRREQDEPIWNDNLPPLLDRLLQLHQATDIGDEYGEPLQSVSDQIIKVESDGQGGLAQITRASIDRLKSLLKGRQERVAELEKQIKDLGGEKCALLPVTGFKLALFMPDPNGEDSPRQLEARLQRVIEDEEMMLEELPSSFWQLQRDIEGVKRRRVELTADEVQKRLEIILASPKLQDLKHLQPVAEELRQLARELGEMKARGLALPADLELRRRLERTFENPLVLMNIQHAVEEFEREIEELKRVGPTLPADELRRRLEDNVVNPRTLMNIQTQLRSDMLTLQLLQARARAQSVDLKPVSLPYQQAISVARRYRHDWMNARMALVDSWRLIRFNADQLQSGLSVLFSGDIQNLGDNPIKLRDTTGRLRAGVQFDAPLTRLSERNTYRQSLIEYQQARRSYYVFEDTVSRAIRSDLRTILTNQINFELQRSAVLEAARQVERNEDVRVDGAFRNSAAGPTAARDAVSALSDLLDAQNNFMSIYTNFEALRRSLDYDLGTLQVTKEGLWVDPDKIGPEYGQTDPWEWTDDEEGFLPLPQMPSDEPELPGAEQLPPPKAVEIGFTPAMRPQLDLPPETEQEFAPPTKTRR